MQVRKFAEFLKYAEEFPPKLTTIYISIPFVLTAIVTVNQNDRQFTALGYPQIQ